MRPSARYLCEVRNLGNTTGKVGIKNFCDLRCNLNSASARVGHRIRFSAESGSPTGKASGRKVEAGLADAGSISSLSCSAPALMTRRAGRPSAFEYRRPHPRRSCDSLERLRCYTSRVFLSVQSPRNLDRDLFLVQYCTCSLQTPRPTLSRNINGFGQSSLSNGSGELS